MIFYHISPDLFHNGVFKPRVPLQKRKDEDNSTPRICVSKTIGGCLTSIPKPVYELGLFLNDVLYEEQYCDPSIATHPIIDYSDIPVLKLFKIDIQKLDIDNRSIINTKELYKTDKVRDSYWTNEHWITEGFKIPEEDINYIKIKDWHESIKDIIPADILYESIKGDGDYISLYFKKTNNDRVPSMTVIENVKYKRIKTHKKDKKCIRK